MDQHKKVRCLVCGRCMRSDHLERHMNTHKELLPMIEEEEAHAGIREHHTAEIEPGAKRQKPTDLAPQEGAPVPKEPMQTSPAFNFENLEESLLKNNREYLKKIEMGMKIAIMIDDEDIYEESLQKDHKLALELYRESRIV